MSAALIASGNGNAAPAGVGSEPVISIRIQPLIGICAGICPDFDVTVVGDHRVELRIFNMEAKPGKVRTFEIPAADVAAFRKELAPLRPVGTVKRGVPCPVGQKYEDLRYGDSYYDIRWFGGERPSRLMACDGDPAFDLKIREALLDISLSNTGGPLTRKQVRKTRECLRQEDTRMC